MSDVHMSAKLEDIYNLVYNQTKVLNEILLTIERQHSVGSASEWATTVKVVSAGIQCHEADTGLSKTADGVHLYSDLPYNTYAVIYRSPKESKNDLRQTFDDLARTLSPDISINYLLDCLKEECGEVVKAASKCTRFGFRREYNEYGVNSTKLASELGNILGIIDYIPFTKAEKELMETSRRTKLDRIIEAI